VDFSLWGDVSKIFWMPVSFFKWAHLPCFSSPVLNLLQILWKASLFFAAIGLWTRWATASSFLLGTLLFALQNSFGRIFHFDATSVIVMGFLTLSHCHHAWSLDHWIETSKQISGGVKTAVVKSGEYTWPIRAVWVAIVMVFFAAGISKLRRGGWEWVFSDSMAIILAEQHYSVSNEDPLTNWGLYAARQGWPAKTVAFLTVFIEVCCPLALFFKRLRWFFVLSTIGLILGIRFLMGPTFQSLLFCYAFWIPWDKADIGFNKGIKKWRQYYLGGIHGDSF
jgi:hypothetical protein